MLDTLPAELREIFAELLWVEPSQVVCGGNSSLTTDQVAGFTTEPNAALLSVGLDELETLNLEKV